MAQYSDKGKRSIYLPQFRMHSESGWTLALHSRNCFRWPLLRNLLCSATDFIFNARQVSRDSLDFLLKLFGLATSFYIITMNVYPVIYIFAYRFHFHVIAIFASDVVNLIL